MKQDAAANDASLVSNSFRESPSTATQDRAVAASQRYEVIADVMLSSSRDHSSRLRPTSGALTSQSADNMAPWQTPDVAGPSTKFVNATPSSTIVSAASSSAPVSSPETGWRAISGSSSGGLWDRPIAQTSISSPADGEPAEASLVAASPTIGRSPAQTSDSGSRNSDPLATLMRLYGTLSDVGRTSTPEHQLAPLDNNSPPLPTTSLPGLADMTRVDGGSVPVNTGECIMRELNDSEGDTNGPAKNYICHVCQYIGTSRSVYLSHMSEHFKHRCTLCGYMTSYAGRLKRHLEDCHTANDERPATAQRKPALKRCRKCGFESLNLKVFYEHVRTHIRPERILECPTASCPFVTEYRHHLELHLRNHLNSRPIRCPICPYRCAVSSMLASHLKSHTKVHRFRCSVCRFSSKFSNALKRHLLEKGHARGYVLNPDGSIPEGGAVPFEPGSPTSRQRQKLPTTNTAAMTSTSSEAQRKPTRSVDVTSEVALVSGGDVKAPIWTPPVTSPKFLGDGRKVSQRPIVTGDQLPGKYSPPAYGSAPVTEAKPVGCPPPSSLPFPGTARARSLYTCAVCGFNADGYIQLSQHVMAAHYSAIMTSGVKRQAASAAPYKEQRLGDNDEPFSTTRFLPPEMDSTRMNAAVDRRDALYSVGREFFPPGFPATSTRMFRQRPPVTGWESFTSPPPPEKYRALDGSSLLLAERHMMRPPSARPAQVKTEEIINISDHAIRRDNPGRSAQSVQSDRDMVVDAVRQTDIPQRNFANISTYQHWRSAKTPIDYVECPPVESTPTSGLPLDLSAKATTSRSDQVSALGDSETKRSRRKGKAYKLDAVILNSDTRDVDLGDNDFFVGSRYSSMTEMNGNSKGVNTPSRERVCNSGGSMQVIAGHGHGYTGERDFQLSGEYRWSRVGFSGKSDDLSVQQQQPAAEAAAQYSAGSAAGASLATYHECRHCGLGFRDGELYAMHMDFHGRPDPFTCNFCGATTGNQVEFFLHVAHVPHNVRPIYVV